MDRAVAVLEAIASSETPVGVSHISAELALPLATAHRQLQKLVDAGLVVQNAATSRYSLAERAFRLAHTISRQRSPELPRAVLREINQKTTFSTLVGKLSGDRFVYLENLPSTGSISVRGEIGSTAPLHATAIGKALLSILDQDEYEAILGRIPLETHGDTTITDRTRLDAEIARVREEGFARSLAEYEHQVGSVAVPFRVERAGQSGAFAICIAGHISEMDRVLAGVEDLRHAADRLEGLM